MAADTLHTFVMDLTPVGRGSCVLLDGVDISNLLQGVEVHSTVQNGTTLVLHVRKGVRTELLARVPEAQIRIIAEECGE